MTEPLNGGAQPTGQPAQGQGQGQGADPAGPYAGYLRGVPELYHGQLLDGFKRTDGHWQKQMQDVQSRYQPYQQLVEQYDPQYLESGAGLLAALQADPAGTLAEIQQALGLGQQADQGVPAGEAYDDGGQPWQQDFGQLQQQFGGFEEALTTIAQYLVDQQQSQQGEQAADQVEGELAQLLGAEYDQMDDQHWNVLVDMLARSDTPAQAVDSYRQLVGQQQGNGAAPVVMPSGGGMPSNQVDPRQLYASRDARKAMAMQIAAEMAQANNQ